MHPPAARLPGDPAYRPLPSPQADAPELQREGFRALSCLALARAGNAGGGAAAAGPGGGAVPDELLVLLLEKARAASEVDAYGRAADDEIAFHAARALSLLSSHGANQRKILEHGGLQMMYGLARLADPDIQAEAATVIANVTSTIYDAQIQACHRLRDHLSTAPRLSPPPSAYL